MSIIKTEDGKKWINSFLAIMAILIGFLSIRFLQQLSEWFDLEAKVGNFLLVSQGVGILIGLSLFIFGIKNFKIKGHLEEVYAELVKVVWPDKDSVVKVTIGIIIGTAIVCGLFVLVDYITQQLLSLVY